ncbi:MAG: DNA mismatch repair protein MutS [Spirochaetaceae bacterium]
MASNDTPMMIQYNKLKAENKGSVLFFRLGDFYEMFNQDAVEVSKMLNITLTKRGGIQMCGIPYHSAPNYIGRLLSQGQKIAICEQTAMPVGGKGIATREVVEIITPGTIVDEKFLDSASNNYLAAFGGSEKGLSFSYVDLSTGEFKTTSFDWAERGDKLRKEIARVFPKEIIIQETLLEDRILEQILSSGTYVLNRYPEWSFQLDTSVERLKQQFEVNTLKGFGFTEFDISLLAPGVILEYISEKSKSMLPHLRTLKFYTDSDYLNLDESTQKNLEIVRNLQDNTKNYTLLDVLDFTQSPMGGRNIRRWLTHPLKDLKEIKQRQDKVEYLYISQSLLSSLREKLNKILDIERLSSRVAMDKAHGKDLIAIKNSLKESLEIDLTLDEWDDFSLFNDSNQRIEIELIFSVIEEAIHDEPSILLTEGNLIKDGFNSEIDRYRNMKNHSKSILEEYLTEEKQKTGINNLKIKYNKILGYFFDVSKSNVAQVPDNYIRRQSLVNGERFTTEKLNSFEVEINSAHSKLVELEKKLFLDIRDNVKSKIEFLMDLSINLGDLDTLQSFTYSATVHGYIRPDLNNSGELDIVNGRHPVVEAHLPQGEFISNDILINCKKRNFALITGPNMAGKSTYLRQVALIVLMAQTGSFVPADSAKISVVDRIFCRVGASDNLARGESTFLVEMNETANILRSATKKSLIIMDEVGRGTSTNDGLSIAWAICEYILENIQAKTLFATHYHELTELKEANMFNLSMAVKETGKDILFLKKVINGASNNSYGIHVAKIAGVPEQVIDRANSLLEHISDDNTQLKEVPKKAAKKSLYSQELFPSEEYILNAIKGIDFNNTTPLEALNFVSKWQKELKSEIL